MNLPKISIGAVAAFAVLTTTARAGATPDFPAAVDKALALDAGIEQTVAPPDGCRLCHVNGSAGGDPLTSFGTLMKANGAVAYEASATAGPALAAIESAAPTQIADLKKGTNPNDDGSATTSHDPQPEYGCGSVAPGFPCGGGGGAALVAVLALVSVSRRRRGRRRALRSLARALGTLCVLLGVASTSGCSDVGDSTALPGVVGNDAGDASLSAPEGGGDGSPSMGDTSTPSDAASGLRAEASFDGGSEGLDATITASDAADAATTRDASTDGETDVAEGPAGDASIDASDAEGPRDASGFDGHADGADAGGSRDGSVDSSPPDATTTDGGADAGPLDAGHDAAPDAGHDSGGGPTPCTSAPCGASGANSVECDQNAAHGHVCTPTEATFVAIDIAKHHLTSAGQLDPNTSCYECMVQKQCLDDDTYGDTNNECGDVTGQALDGEPGPDSCVDNVACLLSVTPTCVTADPPADCFCGTAAGTACLTAGAANGPCLQPQINGLLVGTCTNTYPAPLACTEGDPVATQKALAANTTPAGMADTVVGCAFNVCATECGF